VVNTSALKSVHQERLPFIGSPFLNDLRQSIDQLSLNTNRLQDTGRWICDGYISGWSVRRAPAGDGQAQGDSGGCLLSGQGQLLMLVGEPGIGKTRTAQELVAHAETQGHCKVDRQRT
jgi:predicted NACHT family NTPase